MRQFLLDYEGSFLYSTLFEKHGQVRIALVKIPYIISGMLIFFVYVKISKSMELVTLYNLIPVFAGKNLKTAFCFVKQTTE